jgi:hypothetical protein
MITRRFLVGRWILCVLAMSASVCLQACEGAPASPTRTGGRRIVHFSSYDWEVKTSGELAVGPGPNMFSDDVSNVTVDGSGALHLGIRRSQSIWRCAEVILSRSLGYGRYTFVLESGFEQLDRNAVLGLFTWDSSAPELSNREIDIEFSRWGVEANQNSQFVVQPYSQPNHLFRFDFPTTPVSNHSFTWTRDAVVFESRPASGGGTTWTYGGSMVPTSANERVRINLWLFNSRSPSRDQEQEVVIRSFQFVPAVS